MHCDQVRKIVLEGQLMTSESFNQALADWLSTDHALSDGDGFVRSLVQAGLLTDFQARGVQAGVPGPYKLGPYEVFDRIAAGRLGIVFRARHAEFDQPVALKIYPLSVTASRERAAELSRELRIAVLADHPHVIRTFQVARAGETVFSAIEDLQGETLATRLKREAATATPSLPIGEACRLIREAALGMQYLHDQGVILRDVQPANLWITSAGHLKIMEFGAAEDSLAFLDDADVVQHEADELHWNFDYVSPEQGEDEQQYDVRSDLYSLGCVLFHCLTGRVVFNDRNPLRKMIRHARDVAPSAKDINSSLPDEVVDLVARMLAKNPADRPANAAIVASVLEPYCEARDVDEEIDALTKVVIRPSFVEWVSSLDAFEGVEELPLAEADPAIVDFLQAMKAE